MNTISAYKFSNDVSRTKEIAFWNVVHFTTEVLSYPPVNLVLRMRNNKRELHDIRFEFAVGKDSSEGIASELVEAGLVDNRDTVVMAANLQKLIDNRHQIKTVTFQLNSGYNPGEVPDEKSLIGYAQISITD